MKQHFPPSTCSSHKAEEPGCPKHDSYSGAEGRGRTKKISDLFFLTLDNGYILSMGSVTETF